jgi:hypothetical protein
MSNTPTLKGHDTRRAVVKHGILVGITVAAAAVAGLVGCSDHKSNTGPLPTSAVVIDGQNQNITGQVSCNPVGGNLSIGIGDPDNGVGAVITTANPPAVQSVGFGNPNGSVLAAEGLLRPVTFGYSASAPNHGNAQATKNGNSYTIEGTATGYDSASPDQPVTKPFEMDVTCPEPGHGGAGQPEPGPGAPGPRPQPYTPKGAYDRGNAQFGGPRDAPRGFSPPDHGAPPSPRPSGTGWNDGPPPGGPPPNWDGPPPPGGWNGPPPPGGWNSPYGGPARNISSGRSDFGTFNFDSFTVIPVFNPVFRGWGFWYFGVWIPLY